MGSRPSFELRVVLGRINARRGLRILGLTFEDSRRVFGDIVRLVFESSVTYIRFVVWGQVQVQVQVPGLTLTIAHSRGRTLVGELAGLSSRLVSLTAEGFVSRRLVKPAVSYY